MSATRAVSRLLAEPSTAQSIATELRGMAGELMARSDVASQDGRRMSAYQAAQVLLDRADDVEGISR